MATETSEGITKGDVLQRIAGVALIAGAIVTGVFNGLFPRVSEPDNISAVLTELGKNETIAQVYLLLLAIGLLLLLGGFAGVYRSLSTGAGAAWARLGFYALVVATAIWTVLFGLGLAQAGAAADWLEAVGTPAEATAYSVGASLYAAVTALLSMATVVQFTALILIGVAISLSTVYPRWLGWLAILLGAVTIPAVGIPLAIDGPSEAGQIIFVVFSLLALVWTLVIGVLITRKAW